MAWFAGFSNAEQPRNLKSKMLPSRVAPMAFPLAVLALVVGHFAPWAQPSAAALTLSAHELATFTNYTPHAGVFFNEGYLLPLWAAALMLAAHARRRPLMLAAAAALLFLALPGYPELRNIANGRGSEFALQLVISVLLLPTCAWLGLRMSGERVVRASPLVAAAAAVTSMIGFVVVRSAAIEPLYGVPVALGWGWWCTLCAAIACVAMFGSVAGHRR